MTTIRVDTDIVSLAVTLVDDVVTNIRFHGDHGHAPASLAERRVAEQLREYAAGRRRTFDFPINPRGTPFQQAVWDELCRIPYGEVHSYADIARAIGRPTAYRAVGTANHHNPIPLVIPCHRVVATDGSLTGFGGGLPLKRRLLELEGARTRAGQLAFL